MSSLLSKIGIQSHKMHNISARCFCSFESAQLRVSTIGPSELREIIGKDKRAYITWNEQTNKFKLSHPELSGLVEVFDKGNCSQSMDLIKEDEALSRDFDAHEGIFIEVGKETDAIYGAFVHKTKRGAGAGGLRYWTYDNLSQYLCDGLRLSRGMGRKNALSGLWWGGGKGIIWREDSHNYTDRKFRDVLFREYGEFITSLNGCYITAEDLGVTVDDMRQIFSKTRYATCVPEDLGGSGNPSIKTGHGIVAAMEGALEYDGNSLHDKTISIQGFGNVSQAMVRHLYEQNTKYKIKSIYATDINSNALEAMKRIKNDYPNVNIDLNVEIKAFGDNSALFEEVDIVSPCAVGGILNAETIPKIKAKYVVGAANNQLLDDVKDDELMMEYGKYYVPDFLANRMGIVNCSNEQYGRIENDDAIERHFSKEYENSIYNMVHNVFERSEDRGIPTGAAANMIADELMKEEHPIWNHRPWKIIESLVDNKWHKQKKM